MPPAAVRPPPIAILIAITAIGPLALNIFLPSLPGLVRVFHTDYGTAQLALTLYLVGIAGGQLIYGPLSDRFGRRPVLAAGFLLYASGAGLGALAPSIEVLIAARAMQGMGIAATMVCGRAMVRDLFEQQHGTHVMAVAMSALACMTMLIPVTGALLTQALGWRSTLWSMALCGLAGVALVLLRVPETARALNPGALQLGPLFAGYARIARNPAFRSWTLLNSCGFAANFGFFSSSAYLFIETFGVSRVAFGLVIGGASVTYLMGTFLCRRWIAAHGIVVSVRRAGFLSLAAAVLLIAPQLANAHTPVTLAAGLWLMLLAYGIHQPCGHVGMATPFPLQAGAASALGGFIFAAAAFLCGTWMGVMYRSGSAAVLSLTTGVLVASTGLIALTLVQRHGRPEVAQPVTP